jgi:alpha-mannosidase
MRVPPRCAGPTTDALEEAVSLCQHHDAVTGTARQHVANDYHRRLHRGAREAQAVVTSALRRLLAGETIVPKGPHTSVLDAGAAAANTGVARRLRAAPTPRQAAPAAPALELCDWLNVTSCAPTVRLSRQQESMLVVVYNQLAWARAAPVRVPMFSAATAWAVQGAPLHFSLVFVDNVAQHVF